MEQQRANSLLFTPIKMGDLILPNRIVMAALTRMRADKKTGIPNELHAQYYSARADSGFILTECSAIRPDGNSFVGSAGIYTEEQALGWKKVVDAVHEKGGRIFLQIWHAGRAAHPEQIGGLQPISSSAIAINGSATFVKGKANHQVPKAATIEDIQQLLRDFRKGAENAKKAGFDGIQLHGAHGYLIDQFLRNKANQRTDEYGGSIENRCRFPLQVMDQLIEVFGSGRVGIKVSPIYDFNDNADSDPFSLYSYFIEQLNKRQVAFLEINEAISLDPAQEKVKHQEIFGSRKEKSLREIFKPQFSGLFITNYKLTFEKSNEILQKGHADLCSFGTSYVFNDQLVEKYKTGSTLNGAKYIEDKSKLFREYFYGSTAVGYTDLTVYQPKL
ncbi:fad fmn-binding family protein [Stylonychia lemnae]|uniref:Fad fmn-binding family protein n=1 Tax=Stylonychia lemnae TaxID=5949 RepID=A0A077ZRM4_STYLE|nr:fad fmn-binding family protein [Stylonychia lemnae]|eukprot:CDW72532.1 fad fmn-binding family protein [Stylonychia lemnae]